MPVVFRLIKNDTFWCLGLHKAQISLCLLRTLLKCPTNLDKIVMKPHGQIFKAILYWGWWAGDWSECINICKVGRDHYLIGLTWINSLMLLTGLQIPQHSRNPKLCWYIFYFLILTDFNVVDGRKSKGLAVLKLNNYVQGRIFAKFCGGFRCSKKGLWELAVKRCLEFEL